MININFTDFELKYPLSVNDFLVGYNENGLTELRTTVSDVLNLFSDYQNLSFDDTSKILTISKGNTVSLSALDATFSISSAKYDSTYTSLNTTSALYDSVYSTLNAVSSLYDSVYTSLNTTSGLYDSTYTTLNTTSGLYDSVYSTLNSVSGLYDSTYTTLNTTSALYDSTYTSLNTTSGLYDSVYNTLNSVSGLYDSVYNTLNSVSGLYDSVYNTLNSVSGLYDSTYTSLNTTSGLYDSVYSTLNAVSSLYDSTYTSLNTTSGLYDSVYTSVQSNSATWNGVLPIFNVNLIGIGVGNYNLIYEQIGGLLIIKTGASDTINIVIPNDSNVNFPFGSKIKIMRYGDGSVSLSDSDGVSIKSSDSLVDLKNNNSVATIVKIGSDEWLLYGDLA